VKVAAVFAVLAEEALLHQVAFFILVADPFQVIFLLLAEFIGVDKAVAPCVVRWVNDDALYLAVIGLLQDLEDF